MLALPFQQQFATVAERATHLDGSATILVAVAGMLPAISFRRSVLTDADLRWTLIDGRHSASN